MDIPEASLFDKALKHHISMRDGAKGLVLGGWVPFVAAHGGIEQAIPSIRDAYAGFLDDLTIFSQHPEVVVNEDELRYLALAGGQTYQGALKFFNYAATSYQRNPHRGDSLLRSTVAALEGSRQGIVYTLSEVFGHDMKQMLNQ